MKTLALILTAIGMSLCGWLTSMTGFPMMDGVEREEAVPAQVVTGTPLLGSTYTAIVTDEYAISVDYPDDWAATAQQDWITLADDWTTMEENLAGVLTLSEGQRVAALFPIPKSDFDSMDAIMETMYNAMGDDDELGEAEAIVLNGLVARRAELRTNGNDGWLYVAEFDDAYLMMVVQVSSGDALVVRDLTDAILASVHIALVPETEPQIEPTAAPLITPTPTSEPDLEIIVTAEVELAVTEEVELEVEVEVTVEPGD